MKTTKPTAGIPSREDFTFPTEVIVHVDLSRPADDHNRRQFDAFWPTDQEWVPDGVRGQVFRSDLDKFIERHNGPVRVVNLAASNDGTR
ncbi:hypothetical protein BDK92_7088 [Micromonospora pisi]|uniref:Uncharacterized protein n=1 Tax=Micromonospora pisi TaxID=589240 RepID=A0A495JUG3_9ACTN|nr:hypothetical protein [Micromonospora pisi]RKR92646.1 hypothetical protein BDK92_7088 [Micromonospora pisi]